MVNDLVFEKLGIHAPVHEGILSFFVFLAFIDRQGKQHTRRFQNLPISSVDGTRMVARWNM